MPASDPSVLRDPAFYEVLINLCFELNSTMNSDRVVLPPLSWLKIGHGVGKGLIEYEIWAFFIILCLF